MDFKVGDKVVYIDNQNRIDLMGVFVVAGKKVSATGGYDLTREDGRETGWDFGKYLRKLTKLEKALK